MRNDKITASELRKSGRSYRDIKDKLGIPLATLSNWFSDKKWSKEIKETLNIKSLKANTVRIVRLDKIRGNRLEKLYTAAREDAEKDFVKLKYHPLFVAGVMIYWSEGDKASTNGFRISNSDPVLIKIFLNFLRKICGPDKSRIRAGLLIYPDLDKDMCENYWSKYIDLKKESFTKSIVIHGRHKTRRVQFGICTINYSSRFLKEKMLVWIRLFGKELS